MKKSIMTKWTQALRSGDYKQGTGHLHSENKFCCLGVLCDISNLDDWRVEEGSAYLRYGSNNAFGILPSKVEDWAGMKSQEGIIKSKETNLYTLNDGGKTFEEIADIIETNYKEL